MSAVYDIEQVPLDQLTPDPANPRRIGEAELEALTRSLLEWGPVQPIVANRQGSVVVAGHQRLIAARRLGLATIPVIWVDLPTESARLLGLALNKISGTWDEQLLARLLFDLDKVPDVDLTLTGFAEDELRVLLRSLDARERRDRPEDFDLDAALRVATAQTRSKPGQRWLLGDHQLLCGDATKADDVGRLLGASHGASGGGDGDGAAGVEPVGIVVPATSDAAVAVAGDELGCTEAVQLATSARRTVGDPKANHLTLDRGCCAVIGLSDRSRRLEVPATDFMAGWSRAARLAARRRTHRDGPRTPRRRCQAPRLQAGHTPRGRASCLAPGSAVEGRPGH